MLLGLEGLFFLQGKVSNKGTGNDDECNFF